MTDILSPSPYAYLMDLAPIDRQREIYMRQHRANAESGSAVDLARRARDYQARIAELETALDDAIAGFEEGSQYKGDYLRDKHGDEDKIAKLRALRNRI